MINYANIIVLIILFNLWEIELYSIQFTLVSNQILYFTLFPSYYLFLAYIYNI